MVRRGLAPDRPAAKRLVTTPSQILTDADSARWLRTCGDPRIVEDVCRIQGVRLETLRRNSSATSKTGVTRPGPNQLCLFEIIDNVFQHSEQSTGYFRTTCSPTQPVWPSLSATPELVATYGR
jgi:hypothetical protein